MTAVRSTALRRFALVAIVVPSILTLVALAIQLIALPSLPPTIAIHWGFSGEPDGFGAAWTQIVLGPVVGLGIPLLLALTCLPGLRGGDTGPTYRLLGAIAAAVSALAAVLSSWTLLAQRGLEDAADAPSMLPGLLVSFAVAIVVGLAAWFLQPKTPVRSTTATPAGAVTLAPGEQAAWFGTASFARGAVVVIGIGCVFLIGVALVLWFVGAPIVAAVITGLVAVLLIVVALTTSVFHVRVDRSGLSVASPLGFPRFHVPIDDIRSVEVAEVSPLGEFGGYGLRSAPGATGVVLRRGPGIVVTRTSGRRFVVTVEDAARGAALLQALATRDARAQG